ncbi:uncharacterized protein RMCC_1062 [Mycolicibacterium canariasense]|uniref:Serpin domain-containing protein n=1 Tax=Mycolicibacterium canariasense TaxID=228230 RepID=A0A100W9V7_MYCCR|nr:hypothetical protein [Mycolicibacterium canariasense]MCV7210305.1 hypothetical protein [Mycolicibacterium canariasense]ORV04403.1 hypothetical protein AWB94_22200 [Mycolicibacterium canariasense]GAS94096.1 uncharacterized protein RMCC_1062 [Mycolicibacterium canariasense]
MPVETAELVTSYARPFNAAILRGHAVTSPLGLWLLLALAGPATAGATRSEVEAVLGTSVGDAAARAAELLGEPHPAVAALAAVWDRNLGVAFDAWARTLPDVVARGPIPSQAEANTWAQSHSRGMIDEFPLRIERLTRLLLASALATDIAWRTPLHTTEELGGEFGRLISRGLTIRDGMQLVVDTDAAGLVAVAAPHTTSALEVLSVIAAPGVAPAEVDTAAHQVAALLRGDGRAARRVPDEDLVDGHAWTVTEHREPRTGGPSVQMEWRSHLPAWSATSTHDLKDAPGVAPVVSALTGFLAEDDLPATFGAAQTAVASYTESGFEAAAVTAIGLVAAGMPSFHEVLVKRIEVRFNRPYAVLACAARAEGPRAWRGVPVFSAWVERPDETATTAVGRPQPVPVRTS